jgi:hypothetical protein
LTLCHHRIHLSKSHIDFSHLQALKPTLLFNIIHAFFKRPELRLNLFQILRLNLVQSGKPPLCIHLLLLQRRLNQLHLNAHLINPVMKLLDLLLTEQPDPLCFLSAFNHLIKALCDQANSSPFLLLPESNFIQCLCQLFKPIDLNSVCLHKFMLLLFPFYKWLCVLFNDYPYPLFKH